MDAIKLAEAQHHLYTLQREHGCVYLLLDRFERTPAVEYFESLGLAEDAWLPWMDAIYQEAPQRSPALVKISREHSDHGTPLDRSVALAFDELAGGPRSVCGWLVLRADAAAGARQLSSGLTAHCADGRCIYFRYFDPRVLPRVLQLLDVQQRARLLAPVLQWIQLDRDGELLFHRANATADQAPGGLFFERKTAAAIDRIQLINEVAVGLASCGRATRHAQDAAIDEALLQAALLGLDAPEDQVTYALQAALHGARFTHHQDLPRWVALSREAGVPLAAVLDGTPDALPVPSTETPTE
jgi:hypothetical protein